MFSDVNFIDYIPSFNSYLLKNWLSILIGVLICLTVIFFKNITPIIAGGLIIELASRSARNNRKSDIEKSNWYKANIGRIIIYYASKKSIQIRFKELLNQLNIHESEIYYEGPTLHSTIPIPNYILKSISRIETKKSDPCILKIEDFKIKCIIDLPEIYDIEKYNYELQEKLNQIKDYR